MPSFKVYQIEPMGAASLPLLITTAYTNPGGYFRAEYFVAIPDDKPFYKSERFKFDAKDFKNGAATLDEEFVLRLALQQAKVALRGFARESSKRQDRDLYPLNPRLLEDSRELLISYWMTDEGSDFLVKIGQGTELEDLRDYLELILRLPEFRKQAI